MSGKKNQWFFAAGNRKLGPFSWSHLNSLWHQGTISAQTMVFKEGDRKWFPLRLVAERQTRKLAFAIALPVLGCLITGSLLISLLVVSTRSSPHVDEPDGFSLSRGSDAAGLVEAKKPGGKADFVEKSKKIDLKLDEGFKTKEEVARAEDEAKAKGELDRTLKEELARKEEEAKIKAELDRKMREELARKEEEAKIKAELDRKMREELARKEEEGKLVADTSRIAVIKDRKTILVRTGRIFFKSNLKVNMIFAGFFVIDPLAPADERGKLFGTIIYIENRDDKRLFNSDTSLDLTFGKLRPNYRNPRLFFPKGIETIEYTEGAFLTTLMLKTVPSLKVDIEMISEEISQADLRMLRGFYRKLKEIADENGFRGVPK